MQKRFHLLLALVLVLGGVLGGVSAQAPIAMRWFVGLGTGTSAAQIEGQQAVVDAFNASQSEIELTLEVVENAQAYDVLATQIAAGNAPDIVGPMGIRGREGFSGSWLDLQPLIDAEGYDLTDFDPALIEFYRVPQQGQLGLPFAVFPSFTMYNLDLFDEAGIPYPPANYGDPYIDWDGNEREWNMDTIREVAMILTVDSEGNDATMDEFNLEDVVQFGWGNQQTDMRGRDTLFGAGNFIDADGNAVIPDHWRIAENWYHDAMWVDGFYPSGVYTGSELLGGGSGNWFGTGNLAMTSTAHLWYLGWGQADLNAPFDFAPVPSFDGVATAKLHADTFSIISSTSNPDAAWTVLKYMMDEKGEDLLLLYGGLPARASLQEAFFENYIATLTASYPQYDWANMNWDVVRAGISIPDRPSHEDFLPAIAESEASYIEYSQLIENNADVDVDAELDQLQATLQVIYDSAQ
ncbi:MAG: ABC transporter substrate-binding protein [Phototrophicaceae bacterium]|jgi:multiple sugar transport system substrate-binding protein